MAHHAFNKCIEDAIGKVPTRPTLEDFCLSAVHSSGKNGLRTNEIIEWIIMYHTALTQPPPSKQGIKNKIYEMKNKDTLVCDKKRYFIPSVLAPPPPPPPPAVSDDAYNAVDDEDVSSMSTSSSTSSGRIQAAVDEIAEGISQIALGGDEGAAVMIVLSKLSQDHSREEHVPLVDELMGTICDYLKLHRLNGFTRCPDEDVTAWIEKNNLLRDDKAFFYTIRDIFNEDAGKADTWVIKEKKYPGYPEPHEREAYHKDNKVNDMYIRTGVLEALALQDKDVRRKHTDDTFELPSGETIFTTDVETISETFINSKMGKSRLYAGVSRQMTRCQYLCMLKTKIADVIESGQSPNSFTYGEFSRIGHTFRHQASLLGFRHSKKEEVEEFKNDPAIKHLMANHSKFSYIIRDLMHSESNTNMIVDDKMAGRELGATVHDMSKLVCVGNETTRQTFLSFFYFEWPKKELVHTKNFNVWLGDIPIRAYDDVFTYFKK